MHEFGTGFEQMVLFEERVVILFGTCEITLAWASPKSASEQSRRFFILPNEFVDSSECRGWVWLMIYGETRVSLY